MARIVLKRACERTRPSTTIAGTVRIGVSLIAFALAATLSFAFSDVAWAKAAADDAPPDLPIATDKDVPSTPPPPSQPPPPDPKSAPVAVAPPPSRTVFTSPADRDGAMMAFATVGLGPVLSHTTSEGSALGLLFGLRVYLAGIERSLSYRVDVEGRLGGGSDGFLTRDRATLLFGGAVRLGDFGALTLRAGGDARYVRSGIVEYGRIFAPAAELGVYHFGARGSGTPNVEVAAIGGLAATTSLHADAPSRGGVEFDRSLVPGGGGSIAVGGRLVVARVSYLRTFGGDRWAGDLDGTFCGGEYLAVCFELDHVTVDPTPTPISGAAFTTWRAVLSLGIGVAWAE